MCDTCIKIFDDELFERSLKLRNQVATEEDEIMKFMKNIGLWLKEEENSNFINHNCVVVQNRLLGQYKVPTLQEARVWKCAEDPNFDISEHSKETGENLEYLHDVIKWLASVVHLRQILHDNHYSNLKPTARKRKR